MPVVIGTAVDVTPKQRKIAETSAIITAVTTFYPWLIHTEKRNYDIAQTDEIILEFKYEWYDDERSKRVFTNVYDDVTSVLNGSAYVHNDVMSAFKSINVHRSPLISEALQHYRVTKIELKDGEEKIVKTMESPELICLHTLNNYKKLRVHFKKSK